MNHAKVSTEDFLTAAQCKQSKKAITKSRAPIPLLEPRILKNSTCKQISLKKKKGKCSNFLSFNKSISNFRETIPLTIEKYLRL
jgi:hypothetical protein